MRPGDEIQGRRPARRSPLPPYRPTTVPSTDMAAIAALLESRAAVLALRRTLPRGGPGVVTCRSSAALRRMLETRLVDAIVLAPTAALLPELAELRGRLPGLPVVAYAAFRPDDGDLLLACRRQDGREVAVEGVDDPVVGEMVARSSITAARRRALAEAPRMLRLTEPLQRAAWELLLQRGRAAGSHHRPGPAAAGQPGAPLPPVRRRRRAQSQARHRSHPDRLRGPAAGQPRLLDSHGGPGASFRLLQSPERDGAPDRQRADQRAGRPRASRGAGGLRPGEHPEPAVTRASPAPRG